MRYAIDGKYPIETKDQLTKTASYFDKYLIRFHPTDRVKIAATIEKRASELNVCLDNPWIKNYSRAINDNPSISPDFRRNLEMRKQACNGAKLPNGMDASDFIGKILELEKTAAPKTVVDTIFSFDKAANIEYQWDKSILDPIMTVFGSMNNPEYDAVKIAGEVTNYNLKRIAANDKEVVKIAGVMGKDFKSSFVKDPVGAVLALGEMEKTAFCKTIEG